MEDKKAQLSQRRREQILAAARHIFAQNGFRRTKIEQIATYLGIGKGTVYRYFQNKKSLFLAVFEQSIVQLRQAFEAKVRSVEHPADRVAAAVRTFFEFFDDNRDFIEIAMQVRSEFKDESRRIFLKVYSGYIPRIQENLRNGVRMGIFRELDVERTADAISATLRGVLQSFYVREFTAEKMVPSTAKETAADWDYVKDENIKSSHRQQRESLTDKTDAVTALLLGGLLKRDSSNKTADEREI